MDSAFEIKYGFEIVPPLLYACFGGREQEDGHGSLNFGMSRPGWDRCLGVLSTSDISDSVKSNGPFIYYISIYWEELSKNWQCLLNLSKINGVGSVRIMESYPLKIYFFST